MKDLYHDAVAKALFKSDYINYLLIMHVYLLNFLFIAFFSINENVIYST